MKQYKDLAFNVCGLGLAVYVFAMTLQYPAAAASYAAWTSIITFALGIILSICDK